MFGFNGQYPADHPKNQLLTFLGKTCKKSVVEHSVEKPILLHFVNFSTTFSPRLHMI